MTEWHALARTLADELAVEGTLTDPTWRAAFEEVPRHVFVPGFALERAYENDALVTQQRQAQVVGGDRLHMPTSSASMPSVVAAMLDRLDIQPGMRVLEIGTGTGYNAGLLSHRMGDHAVFSVDIDPDLIDNARVTLDTLSLHPTLVAANGYQGLESHAPFDRIIATCSVSHVPPAWIQQLADGGRIVAPLYGDDCALMVLDKSAPDEVTGRFDSYPAGFMPLRAELDNPLPPGHQLGYPGPCMAHYGRTDIDPRAVADPDVDADLLLFLHLHLAGLRIATAERDDGPAVVVSTPGAHADAHTTATTEGTWTVEQRGTQRLWDTVEHATRAWNTLGRPHRTRFGITALDDIGHQYVWLDDPDGAYSWPMPL
jgi:protein-L-isoaspartate(D-aspartate) O-methyltransferase